MEASPIANYLLKLANPSLNLEQKNLCYIIINRLFVQIEQGHSCLNLTTEIEINTVIDTLLISDLATIINIGEELPIKPLVIVKTKEDIYLLYITRYALYEQEIVRSLQNLTQDKDDLNINNYQPLYQQLCDINFPNQEQLESIANCCKNQLSFITGGPGTGKTTTVTLLLWLLTMLYSNTQLKISICAPTGKAANRVKESMHNSLKTLSTLDTSIFINYFNDNAISFTTIHTLLGYIPNSIYFKHNQTNLLDLDILIVDESSMISLPLFYKLLLAINPKRTKHIIFLGDKNQLSSVEEGYVFASIIDQTNKFNINALKISKRNNSSIGTLAHLILEQQEIAVIEYLNQNNMLFPLQLNHLLNKLFDSNIENSFSPYINYINATTKSDHNNTKQFAIANNLIFQHYQNLAVLCLVNKGKFGVENLNQQIERKIKLSLNVTSEWYCGRPIIILENDSSLDLNNGDIGICCYQNKRFVIIFEDGRVFIPEILPKYQLAYAISIHKSQGSEYNNAVVILNELDDINSPLYNKELLYTAVTRARLTVNIYSTPTIITQTIKHKTVRESGIPYFIRKTN